MKTISFDYWTDLMRCGCGGNVGGSTSITLNDDYATAFIESIVPAMSTRDMLKYFKENLPEELSGIICKTITTDFERVMAYDAICSCGSEVFSSNITEEEFESLTKDQLIDRLLNETEGERGEADYVIVDIEIKK